MADLADGALPSTGDGVLDPQPSEPVVLPADLAAFDR